LIDKKGETMKKNLMLFILLVIVLIIAKTVYTKKCNDNPNGCIESKINYEKDGLPVEGVDW